MVMNLNEYQELAQRTEAPGRGERDRLINGALGLAGEAGEVVDVLKKHLFHGHTLDRDALQKELGDVLWYVAALASAAGLSLEEIAGANIEKLRARYPDGFDAQRSQARAGAEGPLWARSASWRAAVEEWGAPLQALLMGRAEGLFWVVGRRGPGAAVQGERVPYAPTTCRLVVERAQGLMPAPESERVVVRRAMDGGPGAGPLIADLHRLDPTPDLLRQPDQWSVHARVEGTLEEVAWALHLWRCKRGFTEGMAQERALDAQEGEG